MRWLLLTGLFPLVFGCSTAPEVLSTQPATPQHSPANQQPAAQPASSQQQTSPTPAADKSTAASAAKQSPQVKPKTELSGEVLFYLLSAEIAGHRGRVDLSAAYYLKAAELSRDTEVAQRATRIAVYARDDKRALKAASLWQSLEPEDAEAHQVLAALLVRNGQADKALEHFEFVLQHTQQSERQGYMLVTSLLSKEKDKQVALQVMKKLIAKRANNPEALYAYSQLALLVESYDEAATTIEKVLALKPGWTDAYVLQTNILTRQGFKAHALEVLRKAVDQYSNNAALRLFFARKLVDAKQYEEAQEQFAQLLDDDSNNHEARYALGLLGLQMNKPESAKKYFLELLNAHQRVTESQYYLGQIHETLGEFDEALKWYQRIRYNNYEFEAKLRMALILAKQNKIAEARELLQNVSPDSLENELRLYLTEGEILTTARLHEEALNLYQEALRQIPGNTRLLYARALVFEKLDRIDDAVRDLREIVDREPTNAQVLNALGYTLVDRTDRLDEGVELISKALKLMPDDPAILDSMGWAYYRLGKTAEALSYLKRAFDQLKDAEIAAHLGEVLWVTGDHDKARQVWDEALRQTPGDQSLLNVMRRFTE